MIAQNLGTSTFSELTREVPCGAWPLHIQNHMMDPFFSSVERGQRVVQWLQSLSQELTWLSGRRESVIEKLSKLAARGLTLEQALYFPWLMQELSAEGYHRVNMSKLQNNSLHTPKRGFRNEIWRLYGEIYINTGERGHLTWMLWRHTELPPTQWQMEDRSERDYSSFRITLEIVWPETGQVQRHHTPVLPESLLAAEMKQQGPGFNFRYLQNFCQSKHSDTLFPLSWTWFVNDQGCKLKLDNEKPLYMTNSNGCVECNDGIGVKKYTYPLVTGHGTLGESAITFRGMFEHMWESAVLPEGFPTSVVNRSFVHMERGLFPRWRPDDWLYFTLQLENNYQITCYFYPAPVELLQAIHPRSAILINPDGTVRKPDINRLKLLPQAVNDHGHLQNAFLSYESDTTAFQIQWVASIRPLEPEKCTELWRDIGGFVSGHWQSQPVKGTGWSQVTSRLSVSEKANNILETLFPNVPEALALKEWADQHRWYENSSTSMDVTSSWLLWFIPVLLVLVLLFFIAYLVWTRKVRHVKPWQQSTTRRHDLFRN